MDHGNSPTLRSGGATLKAPAAQLDGAQSLEELARLDRYEAGPMIGKGGMGEVRQCRDVRLNRHIALKTATTKSKDELSRFVREAQVQGQLEHPSIVPVYELGLGADGAPYFAMKRVRGESLFDLLTRLLANEPDVVARFPRRKLLQAFLNVCQAVDYAHSNGWIHRDLKPANIMLGDFGEVYVLDWGLARRIDATDDDAQGVEPIATRAVGLTTPGSLLGTPGYMSPEQVAGARVDETSDVYALGAILFEVLTGEMLAKGSSSVELLIDTRNGCDARARVRAPHAEVPPELDVACVKATHRDPQQRYRTVRELHDAVDRVLAGERDLQLRADLARQHADAAAAAVALAAGDPGAELEHKKTALHEVGLSLALDPSYRPAMKTLLELMQSVPRQTPPQVQAELAETESAGIRRASQLSALGYGVGFAMFALTLVWVRNPYVVSSAVLFLLAAGSAGSVGWRVKRPTSRAVLPTLFVTTVAIMSVVFVVGPLTILPALVAANTVGHRAAMSSRYRHLIVGVGLFAVTVPLFGTIAGVLPESLRFVDGGLLLVPIGLEYSVVCSLLIFGGCFFAVIVFAAMVVGAIRDSNTALGRERALQTWNLSQLLPPEAVRQAADEPVAPGCPPGHLKQVLHGSP